MKSLYLSCLLALVACSHPKKPAPELTATDSMAGGLVSVTAVKMLNDQDVCFDITLTMRGADQSYAYASNWTAAWMDEASMYHLLILNQRNPASAGPKASTEGWSNQFITCAPLGKMGKVNSLILTPKTLPFKETEGMRLEWK